MDADGQPVDLNNRRTTYKVDDDKLAPGETSPVTRQAILSAEEAARYTYEAVTTGDDDWNPRKFFEAVEAPAGAAYANGKLTWQAVPYAICYLIIDGAGHVEAITSDTEYAVQGGGRYTVQAVNEYGSLGGKTTVDAAYTLTVSAAKAATLVLPYDAQIPADVKAYTLTAEAGANKAVATEVTGTLPANTPVLVNAAEGSYEFTVSSIVENNVTTATAGALTGVYSRTLVPTGSYVLQNHDGQVAFYKVDASAPQQVNAYRAYLTVASNAPVLTIDFGETTGIGNLTPALSKGEGAVYNLAGQRVSAPSKGIFLVNGKKVIK